MIYLNQNYASRRKRTVKMYDYAGFNKRLQEKGIKKSQLAAELHISSRTIAKISKGEKLSNSVITKISDYLQCKPNELYRVISGNPILQRLREEKEHRIPGGIYHELQIRMTYNSNHIEGSQLSEDQTRRIFETNTIGSEENANSVFDSADSSVGVAESASIKVDDIVETVNHFRAIDYCIDVAEEPLSEEMIKHLHLLLKRGTSDELLPWFRVGDYKLRANVVGGVQTCDPQKVHEEISRLLAEYLAKTDLQLEDIVDFHYRFERIHPFQDGNGRVGRLIAFKECLKHNIVPFIIEDRKKYYYYRGLKEYSNERGFLVETCYDGQDTFRALLKLFGL
ncbi:Fic family protein [Gardnerella swidsinskii]|uniref:Fic family protein n=1 Tax=Gardnerella swidsinskii TaxID=2792979 RepID=UPI001F0BD16A